MEALSGTTRARIVTAKFFDEFFVAADDAMATLYGGFAIESPSGVYSSTQKLKSRFLVRIVASCFEEAHGYSNRDGVTNPKRKGRSSLTALFKSTEQRGLTLRNRLPVPAAVRRGVGLRR